MKIMQFKGAQPNFGDELNTWLWPKLMPNFFDNDEKVVFIGIGSTIGDVYNHKVEGKKIVFGAGFVPQYHAQPDIDRNDWDVSFVRGPRTAARLNLAPELALGDSGILLRTMVNLHKKSSDVISFMPHWQSMQNGHWEEACREAGINLIDPRRPVVKVIEELLRSKMVIAEAMHGAIIADAFRIPWVPAMPLRAAHRDKWYDWSESLGMSLRPQRLWPSSLQEFNLSAFVKPKPIVQLSARSLAAPAIAKTNGLSRVKARVQASAVGPHIDNKMVDLAAYRLTRLAKVDPMLSEESKLNRVTLRMLDKVEQLKRDYAA